jgi:hypothetical protein
MPCGGRVTICWNINYPTMEFQKWMSTPELNRAKGASKTPGQIAIPVLNNSMVAAARIGLTRSPSESDMHNPLHQAAIIFQRTIL